MPAFNTMMGSTVISIAQALTRTKLRKATTLGVFVGIAYYIRKRMHEGNAKMNELEKEADLYLKNGGSKRRSRGNVDKKFFRRILKLIKVCVPSWKSREAKLLAILTIMLLVRTYLSVQLADVNGMVVHGIIKVDKSVFLRGLLAIASYAIPSSFVNSLIEYLNAQLALCFRERLTKHYHNSYIKDKMFYQICNLDDRIANPDQRLTVDINKWSQSLSNLYSNFSKPLLDVVLFGKKLGEQVGVEGVLLPLGWYLFSA